MAELYALDTNVYIRALRDSGRLAKLKRFLIRAGTRLRVSAVVALELRAGARTPVQAQAVSDLLASYLRRDRVFIPSVAAYLERGRVLAALGATEGGMFREPARSSMTFSSRRRAAKRRSGS